MTDTGRIIIAAVTVALGIGISSATQAKGRAAGLFGPDPAAMFARLDADSSGGISRTEMADAQRLRFEAMDANSDGAVTRDEIVAHVKARAAERGREASERRLNRIAGRMMSHADQNDDGRVTLAELSKGRQDRVDRIFDRIDADNSGEISLAEVEAAAAKRKKRQSN